MAVARGQFLAVFYINLRFIELNGFIKESHKRLEEC